MALIRAFSASTPAPEGVAELVGVGMITPRAVETRIVKMIVIDFIVMRLSSGWKFMKERRTGSKFRRLRE